MAVNLSDKLEMYLKTILQVERSEGSARPSRIAEARGVSGASVTEAIQTLQEKGLVAHEPYGDVRLSARGRKIAEEVERRYEVVRYFLREVLGVNAELADRDACEIEHVASAETMERLTAFLDYVNRCKLNLPVAIAHFQDYFEQREDGHPCDECEVGKETVWTLKLPQ